jgi:hypothetical protein
MNVDRLNQIENMLDGSNLVDLVLSRIEGAALDVGFVPERAQQSLL